MTVVDGSTVRGRRRVRADVCIVGTGAGGAPVAKELSEAGLAVVVLEEGPHVPTDALTARPGEMLRTLYRDAGQTVTLGNPPVVLPLGRAVGGSTLVNSGTCFRPPRRVVDRWREEFALDLSVEALEPQLRHVEAQVRVTKVTPQQAGHNAEIVRRGAAALGWSGDFISRNAHGCVGSGVCAFGCPTSAKQHTAQAWLTPAWHAGAVTWASTRATGLDVAGGRARAVLARTAGGGRLRVECDHVVVSAGTIHTPLLLERARIGRASGELGGNLSLHPATAVLARFDEEVDLSTGVPQSFYVDELADRGIMFEGVGGPPDYLATVLPMGGERHRELMLDWRRLSQFGLMISDRARGTVRERLGRPLIRYSLLPEDVEAFRTGMAALVDLYSAAGARSILLPGGQLREVAPGESERVRRAPLRASDLKLMAFHPLGTARADGRPGRGVVDGDLRVKGTDNVWVADGSVVPSALGVNPQITIMTFAVRLAWHLLGRAAPRLQEAA